MICAPYIRSRNTCAERLLRAAYVFLIIMVFPGCASIGDIFHSPALQPEGDSSVHKNKRKKVVSSQFEWAVQNYEAGNYEKAIGHFKKLNKLGADAPSFELIPFYLGMSHFHRNEDLLAKDHLENFLKLRTVHREGQDARLALLASYERLGLWDQLLGLAAETDKLTLFQDNRAFLKLVWARALKEKGEFQGAKVVLKDATQYLGQYGGKSGAPELSKDLWGRYYFTALLLRERECEAAEAKRIGKGRSQKYLYGPWLESTVDCLRKTVDQLVKDLIQPDSAWATAGIESFQKTVTGFGKKLNTYLENEMSHLASRRRLEDESRQHLYRLLSTVDKQINFLKNQGINEPNLQPIRKQIDLLLVSLANPS